MRVPSILRPRPASASNIWTTSLAIVKSAPVIGHGTGSIRHMFERVGGRKGLEQQADDKPA